MRRKLLRRWLLVALVAVTLALAVALALDWRADQPSYPTNNYSVIEEGLYLGGLIAEAPLDTRAVLNVSETKDPYTVEVHRWRPIPDAAPAPGIDWLRDQVDFVDEQRRALRPVYVHCAAGISRGPMVMAAYLMARDSCSRDDALKRIRARRRIIGPNPAFMQLLLEWEETLKKGRSSKSQADRAPEVASSVFERAAGKHEHPPFGSERWTSPWLAVHRQDFERVQGPPLGKVLDLMPA
jgi:protein-tyrosine phosphatase